jgi:hypothetical protein
MGTGIQIEVTLFVGTVLNVRAVKFREHHYVINIIVISTDPGSG